MCEACDGANGPGGGNEDRAGTSLTRRRVLAMGASTVAGMVVGLWSCQPDMKRDGVAQVGPTSTNSSPLVAATKSNPPIAAIPATTQAAGERIAETQGETTSTKPIAGAPDLGSEVFPDAAGKAIAQPGDAPVIVVPRSNWAKGGPKLRDIAVMNGIERITVHHTAGEIQTDAWVPTAGELESIREFHSGTAAADRNWADIAYHFAVDPAGRVWQARPLAYQGAHVRGHNEHNMGIVLLGNFEVQSPSAAQLTSLKAFVGFVRGLYGIPPGSLYTHGELGDTSCPGKTLQAFMNRWRNV